MGKVGLKPSYVWLSRKSHYTYSKNNTFMVEFERNDDVTIFIMMNYHKIIYCET